MVKPLQVFNARTSDLGSLERRLSQCGKTQLIFLDANVVLDGLFPERRFGGHIPERKRQIVECAGLAMDRIKDGSGMSAYALALFRLNYIELRDVAQTYGETAQQRFYSWLSAATRSNHPFVMLEGDTQLALPLDVKAAFVSGASLHVGSHSNAWDKALAAVAVKIARVNPSCRVKIVSHDWDINNSEVRTALGLYGVSVCDARRFYDLLQPRTALTSVTTFAKP